VKSQARFDCWVTVAVEASKPDESEAHAASSRAERKTLNMNTFPAAGARHAGKHSAAAQSVQSISFDCFVVFPIIIGH
jgi:hypothetical protein